MSYKIWKNERQEHLAKWVRCQCHDESLPLGIFNYRGKVKTYRHILPLEASKSGKEAIVNAIKTYNVLTDGVRFDENLLPLSKVHHYAHHLTSSQILCYNYFMLMTDEGKVKNTRSPKKELIGLLKDKANITISENARCQFEYVDDTIKDGTNFDFHIIDDNAEVYFEIKFTEDGFGRAKEDDDHKQKFNDVYLDRLKEQKVCDQSTGCHDFLKNYQLFRNVIRVTGTNKYVIFIFPRENESCTKMYEAFKKYFEDEADRHVKCWHWEELLKDKPNLCEKYFGR